MDTVTYPDLEIEGRLDEGFVCTRLQIEKQGTLAKRFGVIWTPGLIFLNGSEAPYHRAYGYHPPADFRSLLDIALGLYQMEQGKYPAAIATMERSSDAPEALYWLGVLHYKNGEKEKLIELWNELLDRDPDSLWAKKASFIREPAKTR